MVLTCSPCGILSLLDISHSLQPSLVSFNGLTMKAADCQKFKFGSHVNSQENIESSSTSRPLARVRKATPTEKFISYIQAIAEDVGIQKPGFKPSILAQKNGIDSVFLAAALQTTKLRYASFLVAHRVMFLETKIVI